MGAGLAHPLLGSEGVGAGRSARSLRPTCRLRGQLALTTRALGKYWPPVNRKEAISKYSKLSFSTFKTEVTYMIVLFCFSELQIICAKVLVLCLLQNVINTVLAFLS